MDWEAISFKKHTFFSLKNMYFEYLQLIYLKCWFKY